MSLQKSDEVGSCFCFMCTSVLFVSTSVNHMYFSEAEREHQIPLIWSCRWFRVAMWMLGMEPGPLRDQPVLLTDVPLPQPQEKSYIILRKLPVLTANF